jgi:hypothetical protein
MKGVPPTIKKLDRNKIKISMRLHRETYVAIDYSVVAPPFKERCSRKYGACFAQSPCECLCSGPVVNIMLCNTVSGRDLLFSNKLRRTGKL